MNAKKSLVKNTIIIAIGKLCTQFISFLLIPLYTYFISTSEYGYYDLILTYTSLLTPILTLSLDMAVFRFLIDEKNDCKKKTKIITTAIVTITITTIISAIILVILNKITKIEHIELILIYTICYIFAIFFLQIVRGLGDNKTYAFSSLLTTLVLLILSAIQLIFIKNGISGILIANIIGYLVCIIYIIKKEKIYKYIKLKEYDKNKLKELLQYSFPLIPNSISWWIINASDKVIISTILNISMVGIYAVSNKISTVIASLFGIFNLAWCESTSKNISEKDHEKYFSEVINIIIVLMSIASTIIIMVLPYVFNIIIGKAYINSYNYIPILIIGTLCNSIVSLYSGIYIGKKMTKKIMSTSILAAIINISINLLLIKHIKLYAAALSTAIAYFIMMIYRGIEINKYEKIDYNKKTIFKCILMIILSIISYYINNIILRIITIIAIISIIFNIVRKDKLISSSIINTMNTLKNKKNKYKKKELTF